MGSEMCIRDRGYVTDETYRVFYAEAAEDIVAFAAGSPVRVLSS